MRSADGTMYIQSSAIGVNSALQLVSARDDVGELNGGVVCTNHFLTQLHGRERYLSLRWLHRGSEMSIATPSGDPCSPKHLLLVRIDFSCDGALSLHSGNHFTPLPPSVASGSSAHLIITHPTQSIRNARTDCALRE